MREAGRILLEVLKGLRSKEALVARAALAEQRGLMLLEKAKGHSGAKARRICRRGDWWLRRASALRTRASLL